MYSFFSSNETELKTIIQNTLSGKDALVSAQPIRTGWTNITMDVKGEVGDYIFRFPRNSFFAQMMVKDCQFCHFLQGKVSLPIPDMHLKVNQNRPFSVHKKIQGTSLTSQMDRLTPAEQAGVIEDLSQFLKELHTLSVDSMPLDIRESLGDFVTRLATVHCGNYDLSKHQPLHLMEAKETSPVIVHGDFHPGNLLVNQGRLSGVIDFAFAAVSDRHADLGRFLGRSNRAWGGALIESYQAKTHTTCSPSKIQDIVDVFRYVEYKYVEYVRCNHPDIKIHNSVLMASALEAKRASMLNAKRCCLR